MAKKKPRASDWPEKVVVLSNALGNMIKSIKVHRDNPFVMREIAKKAKAEFEEGVVSSIIPSTEFMSDIDGICAEHSTTFWSKFEAACKGEGWSLVGTTNRRLANECVFVELKDEKISIEGLGGNHFPFVPEIFAKLKQFFAEINTLDREFPKFIEILEKAYEMCPGEASEKPIEEVYRAAVMLVQKPAFWKNTDLKTFVRLTRPAFRRKLTQCLRSAAATGSGRQLRLGTTVNSKQFWEVFAPGESRVVQVGRLAFVGGEDS